MPQNHFRGTGLGLFISKSIVKTHNDNIHRPASKIGPKLIRKRHIPTYLGGFSSKTFKRIVNFDLDGWLATIGGPLEYLDKSIKGRLRRKSKKDVNKSEIITLTFPQIMDSNKPNDQRYPMSASINQIGIHLKKIKGWV